MTALNSLESKFRRLAELREQRDIDAQAAKRSEEEYREYEFSLIDQLEDSALSGSVQFDFGGDLGVIKFQPRKTTYGRILDKNAAMESLEEMAITEEMTSPKIEAKRLNEMVREYQDQGLDLPEGIGYYDKKFISISRKR